ncbi:membrane protein [Agrilactobacillus composti DSM 18527 = JCM 14202]|uniref:Membrane protein n=1 Tax=Agrilactobacillus composti DSM 18527 = JCM 14202 TaxID=1423734 RepID=X0PF73_9LACO|nr:PH domain-containing protein [Agrilactobacillus composti]KRM35058.1 membrane protein [Agrilactobacillus composti DSM 18527 = JCM 14202]GAF40499.1 hypothetical protein JCM14202_2399 [Agrilactobacillus composti DSM 18527 = JCM 14202]
MPKHLHPLAILAKLIDLVRQFILPWIFVLWTQLHSPRLPLLLILGALLLIGIALLDYALFTYEFADRAVIINHGIIKRQHEHIPYDRIQTIQQNQAWYMRPFDLMQLQIETSGHDKDRPEAVLPVVTASVYAALLKRRNTLQNDATPAITPSQPATTYHIKSSDLNTYALTSQGIIPLLAVIGWLQSRLQQLDNFLPARFTNGLNQLMQRSTVAGVLSLIIFVLLISLIISYFREIMRFYHFTLSRQEMQLTTSRGLLSRNVVSTSITKIQAVAVSQTLIRQLFHLTTLQVLLASNAASDEAQHNLVLIPVLKQNKVWSEISRFTNLNAIKQPNLSTISRAGYWRFVRNSLLLSLLVVGPCLMWLRPWGYLSLLLFPLAYGLGDYAARNTGFEILQSDNTIFLQYGKQAQRRLFIVRRQKIQAISQRQTIWMAKRQLSHLNVFIRSGNHVEVVQLRYLTRQQSQQVAQWFEVVK